MKKKLTKPMPWMWHYEMEMIKKISFPFHQALIKHMHYGIIPEGVNPIPKVQDN